MDFPMHRSMDFPRKSWKIFDKRHLYAQMHRTRTTMARFFLPCFIRLVIVVLLFLQWGSLSTRTEKTSKESGGNGQHEDELVMDGMLMEDQCINKSEKVIDSLCQQTINDLTNQLKLKTKQLDDVERLVKEKKQSLIDVESYPDANEVSNYLESQVENGENILKSHQYKNENDVSPFTRFNSNTLATSLIKQPELTVSFQQDIAAELKEVVDSATMMLNDSTLEFVEGYYKTQDQIGKQYELIFRSTMNTSEPAHLVSLVRPYGPVHLISSTEKKATETIYIILPLQGRGNAFRKFMVNFEAMAIKDGHVHLSVVCYGNETLVEARTVLKEVEKKTKFKSYQVIEGKSGGFARGRAFQEGTNYLPVTNPLMFFCDVDIFFTSHILSQCRSQTRPGSKVFYPVVFSLYNPEIVYKDKEIPSLKDQQDVRRGEGFLRDFGFGMTCQYRDDFNDKGGFDLTINGWGSDDVLLYIKYQIVRGPVNSLFHHWHPKHCDKALSSKQYNDCLMTRSSTEGSQIQLGMLYLPKG